jgi:hypothetical protein
MAADASALVQKLNRFLPLKPDELASLAGLEARRRPIIAHASFMLVRGAAPAHIVTPWPNLPTHRRR